MSVSAEGRVEDQNEPKRQPRFGRLGSFWFSTRFTRKKSVPACVENRVHRYFSLCKLEIRKPSMYLRRVRGEL